jgi:predicted PurR-regulated permease PerM
MLFGMWGLALGAPLIAVLRVLVQRLWVEDFLGDAPGEGAPNGKPASSG